MRNFVRLADSSILKTRYGKWYLIDTHVRERERLLLNDGVEHVLLALFRGDPIPHVARKHKLTVGELRTFLEHLENDGVIISSDTPIDSTVKCYANEPPLDGVNLLITNGCNLRCSHCYVESGKRVVGELSGSEWISVLQQARHLGAFEINVSGGEALIHPEFVQIAEHIGSVSTFNANLNTNATLVSAESAKLIAQCFTSVQVSLDDSAAESHDAFRRKTGSFAAALRGIELLRNAGVQTNVGFTLTKGNVDSLDEMVTLCDLVGVSMLNIGLVADIGRAHSNNLVRSIGSQAIESDDFIGRIYSKLRQLSGRESKVKLLLPFRVGVNESLRSQEKERICDGDNTQLLYIMANGDMMPCDKLPQGAFTYGNVREKSLFDTWVSTRMKEFKLMSPRQLPKCSACPHLPICGGACVARSYHGGGSLHAADWTSCSIAQRYARDRETSSI